MERGGLYECEEVRSQARDRTQPPLGQRRRLLITQLQSSVRVYHYTAILKPVPRESIEASPSLSQGPPFGLPTYPPVLDERLARVVVIQGLDWPAGKAVLLRR